MTPRPRAILRQRSSPVAIICAAIVAGLVSSCSSGGVAQSGSPRNVSLLIVGDSVAAQAAEALVHLAPAGATVSVDAVQPGTAPCDWNHGFTDPTDGVYQSFGVALHRVHPAIVAFVFTGNPGFSGPPAGCVDANTPYDLAQLLASYQSAITDMGNRAIRDGATVYLEAPPPRNPAVPTGYNAYEQANLGFQGSPAIGDFYQSLVAIKDSPHWQFDDNAATAVSTPDLTWTLTLPCQPWDAKLCRVGQVQVRIGGTDAVHLDEAGCGAIRFALGLEDRPLHATGSSTPPPNPDTVAAEVFRYGGCQ